MRFPERFENISEIEKKREECVELIDHALRNMRFPRKSINPTTRPQENRRRADQVIKKVRKLFPGEGWESINRR